MESPNITPGGAISIPDLRDEISGIEKESDIDDQVMGWLQREYKRASEK